LRGTKQSLSYTEPFAYLLSRLVSLIAAKAYFFCLDTKETKNQVTKNASLPHKASLQIRQNLGWNLFAAILRARADALQKFPMPCHYMRPPLFYLISPEAVLLTGNEVSLKERALIEP